LLDGNAATGGIALTTSVGRSEVSPTLVYFDGNYLAAWLVSSSPGVYEGVFGVRITPQGSVLSPGPAGTLLTTHEFERHPYLAAATGSCILTWFHDGIVAPNSVGAISIHPFGP
jgi:hypothetical protein